MGSKIEKQINKFRKKGRKKQQIFVKANSLQNERNVCVCVSVCMGRGVGMITT